MRVEGSAMEIFRPRGGRTRPPAQGIILDGDDTLWVTQWLYDQAEQETRLIVESAGLDGDRWSVICNQRDLANVARFGFGAGRFPTSVVAAYSQLCEESGVPVRLDMVKDLMQAASSMFRRRAPLVPGAAATLRELRPDFQLILITKGDLTVQRKRIRDSGLEPFLDAIVIVPEKGPEVFRAVCAELGITAAQSWSVGNSLPSDVLSAMSVGLRGVWIEANVWQYEKRHPVVMPADVIKLPRLRDLPGLIAKHVDGPMRRHQRPPRGPEGLAS